MTAWVAVAGWFGCLAAVATVRVVLGRRWAGTRFVALDARRWTAAEWVAAVLMTPALIGVVGGTIASVAGHPGPGLTRGSGSAVPIGQLAAGVGLLAGAVALMVWSQLTMGKSWRVGVDHDERTTLVTRGPFRLVRNPIYTSMVVFAAGVVVLVPTAAVAAGWLAAVLFVEWQVRAVEEPFLARSHRGEFLHWSVGTGRFVPRLGALR
jgi:protein-S-isoprenylcysteine O-methyltransferase Ste14